MVEHVEHPPGNEPAHLHVADKEKKYWLNKLSGELVKSYFPYDRIISNTPTAEKMLVEIDVPNHLLMKLNHITNQSDKNLYVFLTAALTILIGKYTGNNDIIFAAPIYKQQVEGKFINTVLVIRNRFRYTQTIKELLVQVKQALTEANQNLNYPLDRLLYHLGFSISHSREFPLSETAVLLENIHYRKYLDHLNFNMLFSFSSTLHSLNARVEYNPQLYRQETVERIAGHFILLLEESVKDINTPIGDIMWLSEGERRLLVEFNKTQREYPGDKTLHELFEDQVQKTPDKIAVVVHPMGKEHPASGTLCSAATYRELNKRSNQLARLLRAKGTGPGAVVGIMAHPTIEMIIGILAVLKAGGTYLPLEPQAPVNRLKYMLTDSNTRILLTLASIFLEIENVVENSQNPGVRWWESFPGEIINIDDPGLHTGGASNLTCICSPEDNVYAIYTSGTTGNPKGVLVKHENMVNYVSWFSTKVGLTGKDKTFLTSSFIFDMGYTNIFTAILNGGELHLGAREAYLDPGGFLDSLSIHEITYLKMTPSLFNVIVNSPGFTAGKCRSLKLVVLGGETINITDIQRLLAQGPHIRVIDEYGPTETTIGSIAMDIDSNNLDQYLENPAVGRPIDNTRVFILDNRLNPVPIGIRGEIYISGDGVAAGYLNNPALTFEKFLRHNFQMNHGAYKSYIIYKTGDLGRWRENGDGNIQFLGRIDNQVKIRGYRIETGEIESRLLAHKGIKEAAVLPHTDDSGNKYLCAYFVPADDGDPAAGTSGTAIKTYLSQSLPEYMVPAYYIRLETFPLTAGGKLDHRALPLPAAASDAEYMAPTNTVQEKLLEIWLSVLDKREKRTIGINDSFFELGGNSLSAVTMISKIHKELKVKILLAEVFKTPTIIGLSAGIEASLEKDRYVSLEAVEEKEYYPLSSAQARMFTLQQLDVGGTAYNIPQHILLPDQLEPQRLEEIFKKLIHRHESLRTSFLMVEHQPVQKIHQDVNFEIEYFEAHQTNPGGAQGEQPYASIIENFTRPFVLSQAPLLRVGVVKTGNRNHLLLTDMHHIISDGISLLLLSRDFTDLYRDMELPLLRIQYKDFAQWQNSDKQQENAKKQEAYWLAQFEKEIPLLNLPTDYPRPELQSFEGEKISFNISRQQTRSLRTIALEEKASLYMVLLALYNVFLSKLSGQQDIVIGTPVAGRMHADLENVIGMFVNTLVIRSYPNGKKSFKEFLQETKESTLDTFENQDYQFENLVDLVSDKIKRDPGHNPIFDTVFAFAELEAGPGEIPGQKKESPTPANESNSNENLLRTSKFDLLLNGIEKQGTLYLSFGYCTKLFKRETIQRFVSYFQEIVSSVIKNPDARISEIEMVSEEEKIRALKTIKNTGNTEFLKNSGKKPGYPPPSAPAKAEFDF